MPPGLGDVAVVGDVYCDIIFRGVARMPQWGEEVFGDEPVLCPGGAANVAVGLAQLGVPTRLLARTRAQDAIGDLLAHELCQYPELQVHWLQTAPSTAITVALPKGSERAMISYAPPSDDIPLAPHVPWDGLGPLAHFHLGSWKEGSMPLDDQADILATARSRGVTTSLDVSWQHETVHASRIRDLLRHVDVFMPNAAEACWIAEANRWQDALPRLTELVPLVVIKLGDEGAIASRAGTTHRAPGHQVPVVDTTGAGDSFTAGFLYGYKRHWPLDRSLELANVCGAISVGRIGSSVSVPTRCEAFEALEQSGSFAVAEE